MTICTNEDTLLSRVGMFVMWVVGWTLAGLLEVLYMISLFLCAVVLSISVLGSPVLGIWVAEWYGLSSPATYIMAVLAPPLLVLAVAHVWVEPLLNRYSDIQLWKPKIYL